MRKFSGFECHMAGHSYNSSRVSSFEHNGAHGVYVYSEYTTSDGNNKEELVVGVPGVELSIAELPSGRFVVIFNTNFKTAMLLDEYGYGSHACFEMNDGNLAIIRSKEMNSDKTIVAITLKGFLDTCDDRELAENITNTVCREYGAMLRNGTTYDEAIGLITKEAKASKIEQLERGVLFEK